MISTGTIIFMILDLILGFAIPVCLAWWMIRKYKVRLSTILIGAATFIVFALVLEALVHKIVLSGERGALIQGKTLYYALYGGLMAGLFEETGRFLSMKFLMKKEPTTALPGLAYGAGHGGVEMLIVFGISMISFRCPSSSGRPSAREGNGCGCSRPPSSCMPASMRRPSSCRNQPACLPWKPSSSPKASPSRASPTWSADGFRRRKRPFRRKNGGASCTLDKNI